MRRSPRLDASKLATAPDNEAGNRQCVSALLLHSLALGLMAVAVPAHAEDAQGFIQREHAQLEQALHQPESSARDGQVDQGLDAFVDYDEMTRRAFGERATRRSASARTSGPGSTTTRSAKCPTF